MSFQSPCGSSGTSLTNLTFSFSLHRSPRNPYRFLEAIYILLPIPAIMNGLLSSHGAAYSLYFRSIMAIGTQKSKWSTTSPTSHKISEREVKEMLMLEEYDLGKSCFRVHRIVFNYIDGTSGEPAVPVPSWVPATGGNEKTIEFLRRSK
jgi:hypothetical protein